MTDLINRLVACLQGKFCSTASQSQVNDASTILDFNAWPVANTEGKQQLFKMNIKIIKRNKEKNIF